MPRHTKGRPDDLTVAWVLIRATLEANGENWEERHVTHCVKLGFNAGM